MPEEFIDITFDELKENFENLKKYFDSEWLYKEIKKIKAGIPGKKVGTFEQFHPLAQLISVVEDRINSMKDAEKKSVSEEMLRLNSLAQDIAFLGNIATVGLDDKIKSLMLDEYKQS